MKVNGLEKGSVTLDILIITVLLTVGFTFSDTLIRWTGENEFVSGIPYFTGVIAFAFTPLWALYKKLDDLKVFSELSRTEKVRLDDVVGRKVKYQVYTAAFYILTATYMIFARVWPETSALSLILAKIVCGLILVILWTVVKTLAGFIEVHRFEKRLQRRKQDAETKRNLLDKMAIEKHNQYKV